MKFSLISIICLSAVSLTAAIPSNNISRNKIAIQDTKMALRLPLVNRLHVLRSQHVKGVDNLKIIATNKKNTIHLRWRAITALGNYKTKDVVSFLEEQLVHKKWFMRNASIIALRHSSPRTSIAWSKKMLNDPALVVRTAAVQNLKKLNARTSSRLLWKSLYSRKNFKGKDSLWIRKHIVAALAKFASKGEESKFVNILKDRDKSLHPLAIKTLEKLTQRKLGKAKANKVKAKMWLAWWSKR